VSWLIGEVWPWMLLAAACGALTTVALMTTRVTVERWVELLVEPPTPADAVNAPGSTEDSGPTAAPVADTSPFPALPGAPDERPWEAEELWSRPARLTEPAGGRRREGADAWSEAAASWRTWAQEAASERPVPADGDDGLFEADREAERRGRGVLVPAPDRGPAALRPPLDDDPFPYARPVEASEYTPPVFPVAGADGRPLGGRPAPERRTP
jgi:hypothetical protein